MDGEFGWRRFVGAMLVAEADSPGGGDSLRCRSKR